MLWLSRSFLELAWKRPPDMFCNVCSFHYFLVPFPFMYLMAYVDTPKCQNRSGFVCWKTITTTLLCSWPSRNILLYAYFPLRITLDYVPDDVRFLWREPGLNVIFNISHIFKLYFSINQFTRNQGQTWIKLFGPGVYHMYISIILITKNKPLEFAHISLSFYIIYCFFFEKH